MTLSDVERRAIRVHSSDGCPNVCSYHVTNRDQIVFSLCLLINRPSLVNICLSACTAKISSTTQGHSFVVSLALRNADRRCAQSFCDRRKNWRHIRQRCYTAQMDRLRLCLTELTHLTPSFILTVPPVSK